MSQTTPYLSIASLQLAYGTGKLTPLQVVEQVLGLSLIHI